MVAGFRLIHGAGLSAAAAFASFVAPVSAAEENGAPPPAHISCTGAPNEIRIVVNNVKKSVGLITVELYENNQETFLRKEGRVSRHQFAARAPATSFCVRAPEATGYAIGLYHDENANNRIDKGALGIPTEPYGVSNNPRIRLAAPTVEEALFHVAPQGAVVEIELKG